MKKQTSIFLTAALLAAVSGTTINAEETYTVGICQYVQHEALDLATQGFKDALTEALLLDSYLCPKCENAMVRRNAYLGNPD